MSKKTGVAVYQAQSQLARRNELIEQYLPLVHHVLGRLKVQLPPSHAWEDLVGAGVLGLVRAAESFEQRKDATFKTYAYIRIRGAILDELRSADPLSRGARKELKALWAAEERLHKKLQRPPYPEELAQELDVPVEKLDQLLVLERSVNLLSMEGTGDEDVDPDHNGFKSLLANDQQRAPDHAAIHKELQQQLANAIQDLPEKERLVLVFFYYQDLRQKEIAELLEVSPAWVSHLHARAVKRLKAMLQ